MRRIRPLAKYAFVYLPYGYAESDTQTRYDTDYAKTAALNQLVQNSGYSPEDYRIYAATGTADIAYSALSHQVEAMKAYPETFRYNPDFTQGNFYYGVVEGGVHNNTYMNQYIYNALPAFGIE